KLDFILVPAGLLPLALYHVWLLFTILKHPTRTVIGLNAESRHQWVLSMMSVRYSEYLAVIELLGVAVLEELKIFDFKI
ncbi:hypothetical protein Goarm_018136, partial [Gossypium armourianum]|nr:hypothetical protein [Gossypium armourianum]